MLSGGPSGPPCEGGAGGRGAFAALRARARGEAAQRARWVRVGVPGAAILSATGSREGNSGLNLVGAGEDPGGGFAVAGIPSGLRSGSEGAGFVSCLGAGEVRSRWAEWDPSTSPSGSGGSGFNKSTLKLALKNL